MSAERIWANSAIAGLVLVAAVLIVPGLGDRYLWDDEAETALLAKNVIRFGVPVAWDGASLISQECGSDYDANYLWRQTPWLPIYLTAASLSVFGASAFAARLPFALLGILAVPSMYLLARRLFAARLTALVAAGSLLFSVPFLLHVRQCRYYALAIFAAIWILYFFFTLQRSPRLAAADARACLFLVIFAIAHLLVVATVPFVFFRYVLTLLPVLSLLQARIIEVVATRSRVLAAAILLLALLPDRADLVRGRFSMTLAKFVGEITHHVPGPIEGIVTHLKAGARPGDRVFISYGDLPLRFHTDLQVRGGQGCQSLDGWPPPDWVIVRYFFRFRPVAPGAKDDADRTLQYLKTTVTLPRYRRVDLPVADTIWENIPEPDRHVFRDPGEMPRITRCGGVRRWDLVPVAPGPSSSGG